MGYFSNGTEGDRWESQNCHTGCLHHDEDEIEKGNGCPIILAHLMYAYELCNEKEHPGKVILDLLIPRKNVYNEQCAMLVRKP